MENILPTLFSGFAGALILFLIQRFFAWYKRPILSIMFDEGHQYLTETPFEYSTEPTLTVTGVQAEETELYTTSSVTSFDIRPALPNQTRKLGEAKYVRIKIFNKGRSTAERCRVYVTNIENIPSNSSPEQSTNNQDCIPLLWSFIKSNNSNSIIPELSIPAGLHHFADICHTESIKPGILLPNSPYFPMRWQQIYKNKGRYKLTIRAVAENASATKKTISFNWDGTLKGLSFVES